MLIVFCMIMMELSILLCRMMRGILWRRTIRVGLIGGRVICGLEVLGLVGRLVLKVKGLL